MSEALADYLEFAVDAAFRAGRLTLGYFQAGVRPEFKGDDTPVTIADRLAEELIRDSIQRAFPEHGILGEEFGRTEPADGRHLWIVDPIDGTFNYQRGLPFYGVSIAYCERGVPVCGAIYMPAVDQLFYASRGTGAFLVEGGASQPAPLRVSQESAWVYNNFHLPYILLPDVNVVAKK